jgi:hypothetical protein
MKLLLCPECHDVIALSQFESRACACGESCGKYQDDGVQADVYGPALVIGLENQMINRVLTLHSHTPDENLTIAAWVMGEKTPNVTYHREDSHV